MNKAGLYKIVNKTKDKIYIGCSENLENAEKIALANLKNNKYHNEELQADYNNGDSFVFEIIKEVYPNHNQLYLEKMQHIDRAKKNKVLLYNVEDLQGLFFKNRGHIEKYLCDEYFKKRFGKTFDQELSGLPMAGIEMYYEIITHDPAEEQAIREKYKPLIRYQRKLIH